MTTWFTSDTHFDHKFVSELRGFESPKDHDDYVIYKWNQTVLPGDTVWHLGDVGMGRISRFEDQLSRLNGEIHLVTGNHDEPFPAMKNSHKRQWEWWPHFWSIQQFAQVKIKGMWVLLSHFPYTEDHTDRPPRYMQFRLPDRGRWLLHGHTHSEGYPVSGKEIHVGLDAWGLKPVSLEQIEELVTKHDH